MPTISELEQSLTDAADANDMDTITSIVSSLTQGEKEQFDPAVFGHALTAVANYTMTDPALAASTAATFMQDVGLYTDSASISQSFSTFGQFGNFAGVDAMVNNTDPQLCSSLDSFALGNTLVGVSFATFSDPAAAVATAANFLSHLSLYTDPFAITNTMQAFAFNNSLDGINAVVNNTDPQVYSHLDPLMLGQVLIGISFNAAFDPPGTVAATANFLSHLGLYTDPQSISAVLSNFAQGGFTGAPLLDGVNAVIDNLAPQVYASLDSRLLGQTILGISADTVFDPAGSAATAANFLSHLSLYTDPLSISGALLNVAGGFFSGSTSLDGVNAVINNIAPQVYASLDSQTLGFALSAIPGALSFDQAGTIATLANFVSHLSLYTDPSFITSTMTFLGQQAGQDGTTEAIMAIVDNIDPQVYPSLDSYSLGTILTGLALQAYFDPASAVANVADFLSHLRLYTDTNGIAFSMTAFAQAGVLAGVNAVLNNIDPQVYSHFDPVQLGFTMTNIANETSVLDDHDIAATLGLFSQKLLPYASETYIEQSLNALASDHNLSGLSAVLDYTTSAQWDGLSATFKSGLHDLGITVGSYHNDLYIGSSHADTYFGLGGNDLIDGGAGNDALYGNAGNDVIYGGAGSDTIDGGIGTDILIGGAGADTFVLGTGGADTILDFNKASGGDKLDFRDILSGYDGTHPVTDYIHAHNSALGTVITFDADGAGPGAAVTVATLLGVTHVDIQTLLAQGQILI